MKPSTAYKVVVTSQINSQSLPGGADYPTYRAVLAVRRGLPLQSALTVHILLLPYSTAFAVQYGVYRTARCLPYSTDSRLLTIGRTARRRTVPLSPGSAAFTVVLGT